MTTASERPAPGTDGGGLPFHALYVAALRGGVGDGAEGWWLRYHDDAAHRSPSPAGMAPPSPPTWP